MPSNCHFLLFCSQVFDDLDSLGKTHTVVPQVKFGVIRTNEHISQNPQGSCRSRYVNTQKTTEALGVAQHCHLKSED